MIAVEPNQSCTLMGGEIGRHLIEGIADGFIPRIIARHRTEIDAMVPVDGGTAIAEIRGLASQSGLFVGPCSGAQLVAVRKLRERDPSIENGVTFFCDGGKVHRGVLS